MRNANTQIYKILLLILLFSNVNFSQTTLSAGDIMFIGVNSDATGTPSADEFVVLFLVDVTSGTEIYFTDLGYTGNSAPYFQQNPNNGCAGGTGAVSDGLIKWTASSAVTAGTQLVIRVNPSSGNISVNSGSLSIVVETSSTGQGMNLSAAGEAIHAFQGTINGSNQVTSATMIASLDYDALWTGTVTTCQFSSTISEDPGTGFEVQFSSHDDNGYYSGSMTGSKSDLQTYILNSVNWTKNSITGYTFPISGSFVLPVELTVFTANLFQNNKIELFWSTATEVNNYGFEIERRETKDVRNETWEKIGFVNGHGNSNSPKSYSFNDKNAPRGELQYRLKQIDNDGTFEYSDVVEISFGTPEKFTLEQNFPNPFNPTTKIKYSISTSPQSPPYQGGEAKQGWLVQLKVYDVLGKEVVTLVNEQKPAGYYVVEFDASNLSSGIYFCQLKTDGFVQTKKMSLLR